MRAFLAAVAVVMALGPGGSFVDDNDSVHEPDIEAIAEAGITRGCNPPANDRYCPDEVVTRGEMAAFLSRALQLAPADIDHFDDDGDSVFEADINAIANAGVTAGCNPPANTAFCPGRTMTRAEMATMLVRALAPVAGGADLFGDDDGSVHEAAINAIGSAGIARGCNPPANDRYCPDEPVTRQQMASFLARGFEIDPVIPPDGSGSPDAYVTPDDVGVDIGVGVVGPAPTSVVGGQTINVDGTVLENVVVDGCITIEADNVVLRNVEVRCSGYYPIKINSAPQANITIEHSRIEGLITAKLFLVNDVTNLTISDNELIGGDDAMFAEGNLDGLVFTRNYRHSPLGDASSHYDGFQLGEFSRTHGNVEISFNYFEAIPDGIGVTDLVFATNQSEVDISVVGNLIGEHGVYTLRAYNQATLTVRNNTFDDSIGRIALLNSPGPHVFECNVFESGAAVAPEHISGDPDTFSDCSG